MKSRRDLKCGRVVRQRLHTPCRSHLRCGWDGCLGRGALHSARAGHRRGLDEQGWMVQDVASGARTNDTGGAVADLVVLTF